MPNVIGIRFKRAGKIYYFDPGELDLPLRSAAIVETTRGVEYGDVVVGVRAVSDDEVVQPLRRVIRRATEGDRQRVLENKRREKEALRIAAQKISAHGLPMRLVEAEYTFDGSKLTFYFTADGRVDFRELVKDLAATFRTRIELRQIGVRDQAKALGGIGHCGLTLCCATFLTEFAPVSIKMAKDQNLSLNPTKISGLCGRLLCCLRYEADTGNEGGNDAGEDAKVDEAVEVQEDAVQAATVSVTAQEVRPVAHPVGPEAAMAQSGTGRRRRRRRSRGTGPQQREQRPRQQGAPGQREAGSAGGE